MADLISIISNVVIIFLMIKLRQFFVKIRYEGRLPYWIHSDLSRTIKTISWVMVIYFICVVIKTFNFLLTI